MPACCVVGCSSSSDNRLDKTIKIHRFPKDETVKKKWIEAIHRAEWYPSKYSCVCSLHFEDKCYDKNKKSARLLPNAVPTLFPNSSSYDGKPQKPQRVSRKRRLSKGDDDSS